MSDDACLICGYLRVHMRIEDMIRRHVAGGESVEAVAQQLGLTPADIRTIAAQNETPHREENTALFVGGPRDGTRQPVRADDPLAWHALSYWAYEAPDIVPPWQPVEHGHYASYVYRTKIVHLPSRVIHLWVPDGWTAAALRQWLLTHDYGFTSEEIHAICAQEAP